MSVAAEEPDRRGCYRRLLVVIRHGGAWPDIAIQYASAWATRDAVALVAIVSDSAGEDGSTLQSVGRARAEDGAAVDAVRSALIARGLDATQTPVQLAQAGTNIRDSIAELADRWGADIVVTDYAAPAHLAQTSGCNVLYLPADGSHRFHVPPRRIFVASDDTASALCVVEEARRVAGSGELRRAYVSCDPEAGASLSSATVVLSAAHHGDNLPYAILQAAHEWTADLLVLGTHGRVPQARWRYGSVAAAVALVADMPLLLVPERP
jgi:nucleotide-binding universal stress UspA family protein